MPAFVEATVKTLVGKVSNTMIDSSKAQTWLAASEDVLTKDIRGQYWTPVWNWTLKYRDIKHDPLTALGRDTEEQRKLWEYSEEAVKTALAPVS